MKKNLFIFIVVVVFKYSLSGQDIHFSEYNETPSLVNPALTGSAYVLRASIIYKDQWGSVTVPYRTYGAAFDMKIKPTNWEKIDFQHKAYKKAFSKLGAGLSFFSDKAGDGKMGTNQANLSFATHIKTSDLSVLSLGIQGSVVQKSVDFSKFIFSNQYNGTGYAAGPALGETYGTHSFVYADFAAGLLWRYEKVPTIVGEDSQLSADAGFSVFHINRPKQKFLSSTNDQLFSKYTIHGKCLIRTAKSNLGFSPSFLFSFQGKQKELMGGLMVKYYMKQDSKYTGIIRKSSLGLGAYYRNQDALIVALLMEFSQYAIGFSYDMNISRLNKVSTMQGGPEVTIRYNSGAKYLFQKK